MDKNFLNDKVVNSLFSGLCCSKCKNDFSKNSFKFLEKISNIFICKLVCEKCGKDFGDILLKVDENGKFLPLEVLDGPEPISYDDVIDAHNFIKKNL